MQIVLARGHTNPYTYHMNNAQIEAGKTYTSTTRLADGTRGTATVQKVERHTVFYSTEHSKYCQAPAHLFAAVYFQ